MRFGKRRQRRATGALSAVVATFMLAGTAQMIAPPAAAAADRTAGVLLTDAPKIQTLRGRPNAPHSGGPQLLLAPATRTAAAARPAVSNWQVRYTGFVANHQDRMAFQSAVDI